MNIVIDPTIQNALTLPQQSFLTLVQECYPNLTFDCFIMERGTGQVSIYLTPLSERLGRPGLCLLTSSWKQLAALQLSDRPGRPPLCLWMDPGDVPSLAFSGWHTHGNCYAGCETDLEAQASIIFDLLDGILADDIVVISTSPNEANHNYYCILKDTADAEEIEDLLTDPKSPGQLYVHSWTGRLAGSLIDLLKW